MARFLRAVRRLLGGLAGPVPQVLEAAPHHARVVDQCNDANWAFAPLTFPGIGFVHLADEPRRGGPGAGGDLAHWRLGDRDRLRWLLCLERLRAFAVHAVRVPSHGEPSHGEYQMLEAIGDVFTEQLQPFSAGYHWEESLGPRAHLRAVGRRRRLTLPFRSIHPRQSRGLTSLT